MKAMCPMPNPDMREIFKAFGRVDDLLTRAAKEVKDILRQLDNVEIPEDGPFWPWEFERPTEPDEPAPPTDGEVNRRWILIEGGHA